MEQIDRYEIRRELGRGGMATVFLAFDPRFRRQVAVKVLPRQFTHDPRFLARFEQEAQMIATLEHPAIVPVYDFGESEDAPFLVMRYMSGGSLRDRLKGEPLSLEVITSTLGRLAPAIDYAHENGIIHRDLKPANIFFDHEGRPYLADFGIARLADASQTMTVVGTPAYMSPEQVEGDQAPDGRVDVYALGVMLYELLTGQQPYAAETPTKQMVAHILKPVPDVLEANPDLPPQTQTIIEKAMAKDRDERYATASDLVSDLTAMTGYEIADEDQVETIYHAATSAVTVADAAVTPKLEPEAVPEPDVAASSAATKQQGGLPLWMWGLGALALIVIAGLGIAVLTGGRDDEPQITPEAQQAGDALSEQVAPRGEVGEQDRGDAAPSGEEGEAELVEEPTPEETPETSELPTEEADPTPAAVVSIPPLSAALSDTWTRPSDGMAMVYVPEGSFPMGSEQDDADEAPVHEVSLEAFWIDRTEVTNSQFADFVAATGYETTAEELGQSDIYKAGAWQVGKGAEWQHPQGPDSDLEGLLDHPVVHVSWLDAEAYCEWTGARLPSEAEWEYAARGPQGLIFPWGDEFDGQNANFCDASCPRPKDFSAGIDDGYAFSAPVGSFPLGESWSGALDLSGNVAEWVKDWYDREYYAASPEHDPQGPQSGDSKVLRGGSWLPNEHSLRGANRDHDDPDYTNGDFGFRCVASPGG